MTTSIYHTPDEFFYRCVFPRGRVLTKIEDDLTILSQLIVKYSHKKKIDFDSQFDIEFAKYNTGTSKTLKNYRTEMIRLYGLAFTNTDGFIEPTQRTLQLLETQDFNQFFKVFCLKFQFPNCINKSQSTIEQLSKNIKFKPAQFILRLYLLGIDKYGDSFSVSGNEISNLVFNDLRVTTGQLSPEQCFLQLVANRNSDVHYEGGSNLNQHGREFLGYMRLANLLVDGDIENNFILNKNEINSINAIIENDFFFEIPHNFSESVDSKKMIGSKWDEWYGAVTDKQLQLLKTSIQTVKEIGENIMLESQTNHNVSSQPLGTLCKDIGDLGEKFVLKYEKDKIAQIRPDKVGLVQKVSNDTVLGFDIQSLEFDDLNKKKLIEVKTTNRTYPPNLNVLTSFNMSSNEWETARNYSNAYYIYRVFLLGKNIKVFIVKDPVNEQSKGNIILEPHEYRVTLKHECGSFAEG